MIIDFHTHTFPDKIAEKTVNMLSKKGGIKAYSDGTLFSLKKSMKNAEIDYSVILPVATEVRQVNSINRLAASLNGKDGIIYAGAIHPDCYNVEEILDEIKASGLFGIKLHPDYQGVYFDDTRYLKIMEAAAKRDLITVTHAGVDVGYSSDIRCTPDKILNVLDKLSSIIDNKLVLAHLGGCDMPNETLEKLVNKNVYMDTAFVLDRYPQKAKEIIESHGYDKILFATDTPWADQKHFLELFKAFGFKSEAMKKMLYENAARLVGLIM